jgi:predicted DNA-binding transcriptional regulator YafY
VAIRGVAVNSAERFVKIVQLLKARRVVPIRMIMEELEVSRATAARDIRDLRDRFRAPIVWNPTRGGYQFEPGLEGENYADSVPGLWLRPDEVYALLTLINVVSMFDPGALQNYIWPLKGVLKELLIKRRHMMIGLDKKFVVELPAPFREWKILRAISAALVEGRPAILTLAKSKTAKRYYLERMMLSSGGWTLHAKREHGGALVKIKVSDIVSASAEGHEPIRESHDRKRRSSPRNTEAMK